MSEFSWGDSALFQGAHPPDTFLKETLTIWDGIVEEINLLIQVKYGVNIINEEIKSKFLVTTLVIIAGDKTLTLVANGAPN